MAVRDIITIGVIIFIMGISFFIINFLFTTVTDQMIDAPAINESTVTKTSLEDYQSKVLNRLDYILFGLFIVLTLSVIITGWFIGGNPIFMFAYFVVVVATVILSMVFSNVWEDVSTASVFGATVANFPITNNILSNFPLYIAIIGIIGMVVMFGKPYFTQQNE